MHWQSGACPPSAALSLSHCDRHTSPQILSPRIITIAQAKERANRCHACCHACAFSRCKRISGPSRSGIYAKLKRRSRFFETLFHSWPCGLCLNRIKCPGQPLHRRVKLLYSLHRAAQGNCRFGTRSTKNFARFYPLQSRWPMIAGVWRLFLPRPVRARAIYLI